ncbi:MAG: CotH kinase family protein, partial [Alphaproteobacteria bacterium]
MNGTVRLLSFLAIGAGVFGAALFFSLGAWHRASDFNEARALLISASAFGALLGALMLVSPINGWLNGDFPERKRLLLYCVASIALVFAVIVVAPLWVPMPFKALAVFTSTGALIIVFLIVNEHGRQKSVYFICAVAVIFLVVFSSAYVRYLKKITLNNSLPRVAKTVGASVLDSIDDIIKSSQTLALTSPLSNEPLIDTIHIRVEPGSIDEMAANPPPKVDAPSTKKKKYYPSQLLYPDGVWRRIRYRMRGRMNYHYEPTKPSLRLRLRKSFPLELQRDINLINPEDRAMVSNMLGEELARQVGVLTHRTKFVRLFINNNFFGVYHQTTHEDESMLRLNRRIPGPLFVGEYLSRPWKKEQFTLRGRTDIMARLNPLEVMIDAIYMPQDVKRYENLWRIVSFEKTARWTAALNIASGTHTDLFHNHLYYFDPNLGQMEAIIVDINGHGIREYPLWMDRYFKPFKPGFKIPINERLQPLFNAALRDPRFLHRRNEILYQSLDGVWSIEAQGKILDEYYKKIDQDALAERHKGSIEGLSKGISRQEFSNVDYKQAKANLREWIKNRDGFLRKELETVSVRVSVASGNKGAGSVFVVKVNGNSAARFNSSLLSTVLADKKLNGTFLKTDKDDLLLHPGLTENANFSPPFSGPASENLIGDEWKIETLHFWLSPGEQSYLFSVPGVSSENLVEKLRGAFTSALTGKKITPTVEKVDQIDPLVVAYNKVSTHPWLFPREPEGDVIIGPGSHEILETRYIGPKQRLIISAGAVLKLAPGVSIVSRGQTVIEGSAQSPVVFERLDPSRAWGGLLIHGPATANSRIRHARISGGSLTTADNITSSGMVAVYGSNDLQVDNVLMADNILSDDTLHVVYGSAKITNSSFKNCFGDCIDFDFVDGTIRGLTVRNAGNDGVDLMTSRVSMEELNIDGAKDKGISIGEQSTVTAFNFRIANSLTGIAVKD